MSILIIASYFIAGLSVMPLPSPRVSNLGAVQQPLSIASRATQLPSESFEVFPPALGELVVDQCRDIPSGVGIPAFQPGISKTDVLRMLGSPTGMAQGYWPNTRAVYYELIPEQISLGFLFDKQSERIRQTEASFTDEVDSQTVLITLNGMLGCKLNEQIEQGLEQVWQGQTQQYSFQLGSLEGVIERLKSDRLYIGIWEADLH